MFAASEAYRQARRLRRAAFALALAACTAASLDQAWAALGQRLDSVRADRDHLSAVMRSQARGAQTVHTLSLGNGGVVQEYENAEGVVFAVSWRAPGRPDLRQLLGDHFATMQADTVRADGRRVRAPLRVGRTDLVVRTSGHPGAFRGLAYLPQLVPAGFTGQDLR